jgi:glycine cleavage system H protein
MRPVSGEVTEAIGALEGDPSLVNRRPKGEGWFFKMRLSDPSQLEGLMDRDAYQAFCDSQ